MPDTRHSDILKRRHKIDQQRREKQRELMEQYDKEVAQPAREALQAECEAIGHVFRWISNDVCGSLKFCRYCDKGEFEPWNDANIQDAPTTAAVDGAEHTDMPTQNES
ncbi:MAG: hypothetical protein ACRCYP_03750 [Alphaproteobacteria bacterium]